MPGGKHILAARAGRQIFGTAKVGQKGQIVIPSEARRAYNIKPGDTLLLLSDGSRGIIIAPPDVLDGVADKIFEEAKEGR